jgi:hypothetical protein
MSEAGGTAKLRVSLLADVQFVGACNGGSGSVF